MPVPTTMQDLATIAGSNSPQGGDTVAPNLDDYLRAHAALIRSTNALAATSIAAASTVNVSAATGESVLITGAATINSLGTGFDGCYRELRFSGACTLVNSASLVLPGGSNIVTAAGDVIAFRCTASGIWSLASQSKPANVDKVSKSGDVMTGGLAFGSDVASGGVNDLSRHISLHTGGYGFNVTSQRLNYNVSGTAAHDFYVGATLTLRVGGATLQFLGNNVWHAGNQLSIGTTATAARAALGLGSIATKGITTSTADPSGVPADGDLWLKYTP